MFLNFLITVFFPDSSAVFRITWSADIFPPVMCVNKELALLKAALCT